MCITIYPDEPGDDYDWAVFNLTGSSCSDIAINADILVDCSFDGVPEGCDGNTGPNNDTIGDCAVQNRACLPVQTGEHYAFYISSFIEGQSAFYFEIDESSPNSAIVTDTQPPSLDSVSVPLECGAQEIEVTFSESILCSSVEATDFVINGPDGSIALTGVINEPCDVGSQKGKRFVFELDQPLVTPGIYELELTGTIEDECSNVKDVGETLSFEVLQFDLNFTSTKATCAALDGSTSVIPTNNKPPYSYAWTSGSSDSTATDLSSGWQSVSVTDNVGCMAKDSTYVGKLQTNPTPLFVSNPVTCYGIEDGSIVMNASGGTTPYTYIWDAPVSDTTSNPTNLNVGSYSVTILDANGCDSTIAIEVVAPPSEMLGGSGDSVICQNGTASLKAIPTKADSLYKFIWVGLTADSSNQITSTFDTTTRQAVVARHISGCYTDTAFIDVTVRDPIGLQSTPDSALIYSGDSITIQLSGTGGLPPYNFYWVNEGITGNQAILKPDRSTYAIIEVSDACESTVLVDSITISVLNIYLPTAFTPNGDNLNDTWGPEGEGISNGAYQMIIFDRWGYELWKSEDILTQWDGTNLDTGKPVKSGSYTYKIRFTNLALGIDETIFGYVALIR